MLLTVFLTVLGLMVCSAANTQPCCFDNKFTGLMMQLGASLPTGAMVPEIFDNSYVIDYDYDMKMIKLDGRVKDQNSGMMFNVTVYIDYKQSKRYTLAGGQCMVAHVDSNSMVPPCISGNFTYDGSYQMGSGASMFYVNMFSGFVGQEFMRAHAMDSNCSPVAMNRYGATGSADEIQAFMFGNVRQGVLSVANPFVLPDLCKHAVAPVGK